MTERLDEKLRVTRIILVKLRDGPKRAEEIKKAAMAESPTLWEIQNAFYWCVRKGLMRKLGPTSSKKPYTITEKGLKFLETF